MGPYLTTDRISPDLLDSSESKSYWLQFLPGTDRLAALAELPAGMEVLEDYRPGGEDPAQSKLSLQVRAGVPELEELIRTSRHLLVVLPVAEGGPSDERQGQILAGLHDGTKVLPLGTSVPHYTSWLQSRGLHGDTNQQTVAVFDTGYDDGTGATGSNHLDLETPKRLIAAQNFVPSNANPTAKDAWGHGTAVSAIIAGNGIGTGAVDSKGFYRGTGIAPKAKIVMTQIWDDKTSLGCEYTGLISPVLLENAFNFSRSSGSADRALISNHSWNLFGTPQYETYAEFMDQRVLDADTVRLGAQTMSLVVSAGNSGPPAGSLQSPANAKNVISTGSTQSYRPVSTALEPDAPPLACSPASSLPLEDAVHIGKVSDFSSRGVAFTALTAPGVKTILNTRVKPDLVMPGGRVISAVPYNSAFYTCQSICRKYWPDPPAPGYHSYMNGTSFSAPVASGAVALLRKWFLDRGVATVSPSLLKAALIATADDLGASNPLYANDHRPSYIYGWGRGNLNRATDGAARFYVTDNAGLTVSTGTQQVWTKAVDSASRGTFIVLVWSDPPSTPGSSPEPPLVNDLQLYVTSTAGTWYGNVFNEAVSSVDNGYSYTFSTGFGFNDTINNVEAVFLPAGTFTAGQQITIRVTGVNVANGPQKFAIYAYNVRP